MTSGPARLFVREVGAGQPVVVLHGGPDFDHEYLLPELDRLADQFHVIYYDQRGRGRSFTGEGPDDVTIESEIEDLDRVREAIGADTVALLGHSWGTLLALEYATRQPHHVSHLILMNSAPASHAGIVELRTALRSTRTPEEAERMAALRQAPAYLRGDPGAEAELNRIHFRPAVRDRGQLDQVMGRLHSATTADRILAARAIEESLYRGTWLRDDYDLLPKLRNFRIPALALHGDRDFIPVDLARRTAAAIPGARFIVVEDCGHFAFIEQPEIVLGAIADFVATG